MDDLRYMKPVMLKTGTIGQSPGVNSRSLRARDGRFALIYFCTDTAAAGVTITLTLEDSADDVTFTPVAGVAQIIYAPPTENTTTKAFFIRFSRVREYVRVNAVQDIASVFAAAIAAIQWGKVGTTEAFPYNVQVP